MATYTAPAAPPEEAVAPGFYNAKGKWTPLAGEDHGFTSIAGEWIPTGGCITASEVSVPDYVNIVTYLKDGTDFDAAARAYFTEWFEGKLTLDCHGFLR